MSMNRRRWERQHAEEMRIARAAAERDGLPWVDVPSRLLGTTTRVFTKHATINSLLEGILPKGPRLVVDRPLPRNHKPRLRRGRKQVLVGVMKLLRPDDKFIVPSRDDDDDEEAETTQPKEW